jgi:hypothetical protein
MFLNTQSIPNIGVLANPVVTKNRTVFAGIVGTDATVPAFAESATHVPFHGEIEIALLEP